MCRQVSLSVYSSLCLSFVEVDGELWGEMAAEANLNDFAIFETTPLFVPPVPRARRESSALLQQCSAS